MKEGLHTFVIPAYKESKYLEDCIKSVINQKYKSKVLISTSTPNDYITNIAKKYNIQIIINENSKGIGSDFDFAIDCAKTDLITIAHQDDIYDYNYSYNVVKKYIKNKNSLIIFTDYYEIKDSNIEKSNLNLLIKRILLFSLIIGGRTKITKRLSICFGNAICCPSVCFNKNKISTPLFNCDFKCDVDWYAWEKLSKLKGKFCFCNKKIMGHRVHEESTTTEIINNKIRTKEDYQMYLKFWPKFIAKFLNGLYKNSEKNNE